MISVDYIVEFLAGKDALECISYSKAPSCRKLSIVQSDFFDDGVYGTAATLPSVPLSLLPDTDIPFLFGEPKIERLADGRVVLYADLVASAYFMLSRYEEVIKRGERDQYGRFLARNSVIFQQGYGQRPLVDEWGRYVRNLFRSCGVAIPKERSGLQKIWLTHDVDCPFQYYRLISIPVQVAKNILHRGKHESGIVKKTLAGYSDPYFTFDRIIEYDNSLKEKLPKGMVQSVYFIIAAGTAFTKEYCNIDLIKFRWLIKLLKASGARLGLHVSHEAGITPVRIEDEVQRLKRLCNTESLLSRHHFLRWREPEHIEEMEAAGIREDFTLSYADSVGFRVGTSRPYRFINPCTKRLTDVIIHPMQIMECSLDRRQYMNLGYEEANKICMSLIDKTYEHGGELNVLWHNTSFIEGFYYEKLYANLLVYVASAEFRRGGGTTV